MLILPHRGLLMGGSGPKYQFMGWRALNASDGTFTFPDTPAGDIWIGAGHGGPSTATEVSSPGNTVTAVRTTSGTSVGAGLFCINDYPGGSLTVVVQRAFAVRVGCGVLAVTRPDISAPGAPAATGASDGGDATRSVALGASDFPSGGELAVGVSYSAGAEPIMSGLDEHWSDPMSATGSQAMAMGVAFNFPGAPSVSSTNSRVLILAGYT